MKEAAGEANITVITIVLIALVLAVGTPIVTSLLNSTKLSSCCSSSGGYWKNGKCYPSLDASGNVSGAAYTPSC